MVVTDVEPQLVPHYKCMNKISFGLYQRCGRAKHRRRQPASTTKTMDDEKKKKRKKEYRFSPVIYVTFLAKSIRCLRSRQPMRVCLTALASPLFWLSHIITYNIRFRVRLFVLSFSPFHFIMFISVWSS